MGIRDFIVQVDDLETETVDVPEWRRSVRIRELTGADRAFLRDAYANAGGVADRFVNERVVALGLVDDDGSRPFDASNVADLELLAGKNGTAVERLAARILALSGLAPGADDDAEKKSARPPNVDSGSGSPSPSDVL